MASFLSAKSGAAIDRYLEHDRAGLSDSEASEKAVSETLSQIRSPLSVLRDLAVEHFGQQRAERFFPDQTLLSFLENAPLTLTDLADPVTRKAVCQAMQQALADQK